MTTTPMNKILIPTQPVWYLDGVWLVQSEGPSPEGQYTITDGINELHVTAEELEPVRKVETSNQEHTVGLYVELTFSAKVPEPDVKYLIEALLQRAMEDGSLVHEMWDQRIDTMGARCTGKEVSGAYHAKALAALKDKIRAERSKIISRDGVITGAKLDEMLLEFLS